MEKRPYISVIIPAHNEEDYIGKCIKCINAARGYSGIKTEIIVSANRCTDRTAEIARNLGARVCENNADTISGVRNAGARLARGKILVTVDADSFMGKTALKEVYDSLESGKYIGGGAIPVFDRVSPGIFLTTLWVGINLMPIMIKNKAALSGGMFWLYKKDFTELGGFDESLVSLEDMDFAVRLLKLGRMRGKEYGTLKSSPLTTSARKFNRFGDWYLLKNPALTRALFTGKDREAADKFYYSRG